MNELKYNHSVSFLCAVALTLFYLSSPAMAEQELLKKYIIEFNLKVVEKNLADDSYRGEEGILALTPEEAKSLGLKAVIDQDYLNAVRLFAEADGYLEKARQAMSTDVKEKSPGYYAGEISDNFLKYKKCTGDAKIKLTGYHSRLSLDNDDRLNETACMAIISKTLDESLSNQEYGLRDKLALFYNACHAANSRSYPLTEKNVRFVNYVFNGFLKEAPQEEKNRHDLDLAQGYGNHASTNWKDAAGFGESGYADLLEASVKKLGNTIYPVDPLLFMALMKRESGFDSAAVSSVGAAGLTQIMPETAKEIGMTNIYRPGYYLEAVSLIKKEREARNSALSVLNEITEENGVKLAEKARSLMQESLKLGREKNRLFEKYEDELVKRLNDDRLKSALAIEYGLKYFSGLMKRYDGDISLALAAYNAGDFRVREFNGIPPFRETVVFRNKILQYYREYIEKLTDQ